MITYPVPLYFEKRTFVEEVLLSWFSLETRTKQQHNLGLLPVEYCAEMTSHPNKYDKGVPLAHINCLVDKT